jgi:hypothetical protein
MPRLWRLALGSIGAAALVLSTLLSGCGGAAAKTTGLVATRSTATTMARTPTPSPNVPSLGNGGAQGCPAVVVGPDPLQFTTVDGVNVSVPQRWTSLDFPEVLLPNNLPSAPYQVSLTANETQLPGAYLPTPHVNPSLNMGYVLQVCNLSSASHSVTSLTVTIASMTPSSGPVAVWHVCADGPYDAATQQTTTGCGGAYGGVDILPVTLPNDNAGASAPAQAGDQRGSTNLPLVLDPNVSMSFLVPIKGLTQQGTYALSFGLGIDGAAATQLAPRDGSFLIAPSPTVWTGTACESPAMQVQIPATSTDTYYVCPPSS